MARPVRLDDAERAALAAAVRPVDRAAILTAIAKRHGTLDRDLADMRSRALAAEVAEGRKVVWLAAKLGRSPSLVSKLIGRIRPTTEEMAA
jgi:hypothetical protein